MEYLSPVIDRTQADVINRTTKGFFNVSDWARIANNIRIMYAEVKRIHGASVPALSEMPEMIITSIPTAEDFRALVGNIERTRIAAKFLNTSGQGLFYQFTAGEKSFRFGEVNDWERMIDRIYRRYAPLTTARYERVGVASCGAGMTRGNRFRGG